MDKSNVSQATGRRVVLCVPTLNAGRHWPEWLSRTLEALSQVGGSLRVIDSSSEDDTAALARAQRVETQVIDRAGFDHGGTRNLALETLFEEACHDDDIVIFMTQDALVDGPHTLKALVSGFDHPEVGAIYGRQLPHSDATPIAAHARLFNYPPHSHRVLPSRMGEYGIKAAFLSNSFTAYRVTALKAVGGFPERTILGEDMIAGARLLGAGWQLAYCAEARVFHSHNLSLSREFRRYFDIGVMHAHQAWLLDMMGRAESEGRRFVRSELGYLARHRKRAIPEALLRTQLKYLGYRLGGIEQRLPRWLKRRLSMQPGYWCTL